MTNYLVDTSLVSLVMRGDRQTTARVNRLGAADRLFASAVTEGEVLFGIARSGALQAARLGESMREVMSLFAEILPVDRRVARAYVDIKSELTASGRLIPDNDMWIAAVARANELTLAHSDEHFTRLTSVQAEYWQQT